MTLTIPVAHRSHSEHGGAEAQPDGDPLGGFVIEVENEWQHDQHRRKRVVDHPVDHRRNKPQGHEPVEVRHRSHLVT
jgi:hypothetical protein